MPCEGQGFCDVNGYIEWFDRTFSWAGIADFKFTGPYHSIRQCFRKWMRTFNYGSRVCSDTVPSQGFWISGKGRVFWLKWSFIIQFTSTDGIYCKHRITSGNCKRMHWSASMPTGISILDRVCTVALKWYCKRGIEVAVCVYCGFLLTK